MPDPPIPPASRTNTTGMLDIHPDDHNKFSNAIADLQSRLDTLIANVASLSSVVTAIQGTITSMQATDVSLQNQINSIGSGGGSATAVAAALAAHQAATTSVHGIANTSQLVKSTDGSVGDMNEVSVLPGSPVNGVLYLIPDTS